MNASTQTIGTQIDMEPRASSQALAISAKLVSVQDLLLALQTDKQIPMLRTTAGHVATFLQAPLETVAINRLVNIVPEFRAHLKLLRYKRNAVNSYCNYAGVLLRRAEELGWIAIVPEIPVEWKLILSELKGVRGLRSIVKFAAAQGKLPANFNEDDLNNWKQGMLSQGKSYVYVQPLPTRFR